METQETTRLQAFIDEMIELILFARDVEWSEAYEKDIRSFRIDTDSGGTFLITVEEVF